MLSKVRKQFIVLYYEYCNQRPIVLKFKNIMSSQNPNVIKQLVQYLKKKKKIFLSLYLIVAITLLLSATV